jgi:hypothetical protein
MPSEGCRQEKEPSDISENRLAVGQKMTCRKANLQAITEI